MPSLLEQINRAQRPSGVTLYSPGRLVPGTAVNARPAPRQPPPPIAALSGRRSQFPIGSAQALQEVAQSSPWTGLYDSIINSDAYKPNQEAAQAQAKARNPGPGGWRGLLGTVINNPIVRNALVPIQALGVTSHLGTLAAEETAKILPDWAEGLLPAGPRDFVQAVDEQRAQENPQSVLQKINPYSDYGYSKIALHTGNPAVDKLVGLTGDIALDPLTLASMGGTHVVEGAARAEKAAEITAKAKLLESVDQSAATASKLGDTALAAKLNDNSVALRTELERLAAEHKVMPAFELPLHPGKASRLAHVTALSETNPELARRLAPELAKVTEKGYAFASPELRQALDVLPAQMKLASFGVPGTEALARYLGKGLGATRALTHQIPLGDTLGALRASEGTEKAFRTLARGSGEVDPFLAATQLHFTNVMRFGREFQGLAGAEARKLTRGVLKDASKEAVAKMLHEAETLSTPNEFNDFFKKMPDLYREVTGRTLDPFLRDSNTYVPHMMTRPFKRYLKAHAEDQAVTDFVNKGKFMKEDLLQGSGNIERRRFFAPKGGKPTTFEIGGERITLSDGSIHELNTELSQAFPGFKGKFYEDDPRRLIDAYVSSLTKQAGRDLMLQRAAKSANPLVEQITGPLADALKARNEVLARQNPVFDVIREGFKPGETQPPIAAVPDMPDEVSGVKLDEYFRSTEHKKASEQMMQDIYTKGPQYQEALQADQATTRQGVFDATQALHAKLRDGLDALGTTTKTAIDAVEAHIKDFVKRIGTIDKLTVTNTDEVAAALAHIDTRKAEIQQAIDQIKATYAAKIPAEQAAEVARMEEMITSLDASARKIDGVLRRTPRRMGLEVKRRAKILQAPVDAAREAVTAAEKRIGGKVDPKTLSEALGTFRASLGNSEDYDAALATFRDVINGTPIQRTTEGKITPETMETVQRTVSQRLHPVEPTAPRPIEDLTPNAVRPPAEPYASEWSKTKLGGRYMVRNQDGWEVHAVRSANPPHQITGFVPWYPYSDRNWEIGRRFATREEAQTAVDEFMTEAQRAKVYDIHETSAPFPADHPGFEAPAPKGRPLTDAERAQLPPPGATNPFVKPELPPGPLADIPAQERRVLTAGTGRAESMPGKLAGGATSRYDEGWQRWQALKEQAAAATDPEQRKALASEARKAAKPFQKGGEFVEERAAREQIAKHLAWQDKVDKDEAVLAARKTLADREAAKERQVEAAIYVQRPGQEPYRVLDPSAGFGPGEKRIVQPVEVPKEGYAPQRALDERDARRAELNVPRPPEVRPTQVSREGVAAPFQLLPEDATKLDAMRQQLNQVRTAMASGQGGLTDEEWSTLQALRTRQSDSIRTFELEARKRAITTAQEASRAGAAVPEAVQKAKQALPRSAEATEILSMHPQGSDGWYAATRSILDDDLGSTLHESSLDLVDQIHHLGNADTDTFVAQAWDSMSESGRQRLRDIGWRDPATAEQAALSPAQEAGQVLGPKGAELAGQNAAETAARVVPQENFKQLSDAWDKINESLNNPEGLDATEIRQLADQRKSLREALDTTFERMTKGSRASGATALESLDARYGRDNWSRIAEKEPKAFNKLVRLEGEQLKLGKQIEDVQAKLANATSSEARTLNQQVTSLQRKIEVNQAEQRNLFGVTAKATRGPRAPGAAAPRELGPIGVHKFPENPKEPLAVRAYIESQQQHLPNPAFVEAQQKNLIPEGAVVGARAEDEAKAAAAKMRRDLGLPEPTVIYHPQTEEQALDALNTAAMTYTGGPREQALRARSQAMHAEATQTAERIASGDVQAKVAANVMAEADVATREMTERTALLDQLADAVDDKGKLMDQRAEVKDTKAKLIPPKQAVKKANRSVDQTWSPEMAKVIDGLEAVAKENPGMLDQPLVVVEAELQAHRAALEREAANELRWKEVDGFLRRANTRSFARQQITTVGSNWSMVYKSAFKGDKPILKEGDFIVDKALHQMFSNLYNIQVESNKFGRLFNSMTNLFKTYATLSPGFHVRNGMSGIFMNTADGVSLTKQIQGVSLWRQWMKGGNEWLVHQPTEVKDAFRAAFASGAGGYFREGGFAEATRMERALNNRVVRLSQRAGEKVEGSMRLGMALDSIGKGDTVESATQRIVRVHFDYGDISKMDRTMKQIVPFWTFISRNLPLQVTQMWMRPQLYLKYQSLVKNFAAPNDPFTPEYWLKNGAWNSGQTVPDVPGMAGGQGLPIYIQPDFGFSRVQSDVNNLIDAVTLKDPAKILSEGNPLFTAPLEFAFKKNLYTGQNYGPTSYSKLSGPLNIPTNILARILPGQMNERGQVADAFNNVMTSINPVLDRSTRLLPGLAGGTSDEQQQLEAYARYVGIPIRTLTDKKKRAEAQRQLHAKQQEHTRQLAMAKEARA